MKGKKRRRILSLVMSLCMVLSLLITNSSIVYAASGFSIRLTPIDKIESIQYQMGTDEAVSIDKTNFETDEAADDGGNVWSNWSYSDTVEDGTTVNLIVKPVEGYEIDTARLENCGAICQSNEDGTYSLSKTISSTSNEFEIGLSQVQDNPDNPENPEGPVRPEVGAGDVLFNINNSQNGRVYYSLTGEEGSFVGVNHYDVIRQADLIAAQKIYVKYELNEGQELDDYAEGGISCNRYTCGEETKSLLFTDCVAEVTYSSASENPYEISISFKNNAPIEDDGDFIVKVDGETVFDGSVEDDPATENDERITVPEFVSNAFMVFVNDWGEVVFEPNHGTGIDRGELENLSDEDKESRLANDRWAHCLAPIETTGSGTVVVEAGLNYEVPGGHNEEIVPVTIVAGDDGYSFKSDNGNGELRIDGGGTFGSSVWIAGSIKTNRFSTRDVGHFYFDNAEESIANTLFEATLREDGSVNLGSYVELSSGIYDIYTNGAVFKNYDTIAAVDEACIKINGGDADVFDNVNHASVQTGGSFDITSGRRITFSDGFFQAKYYTEIGEILSIPADGRVEDKVNSVTVKSVDDMGQTEIDGANYILDDSENSQGRYIFKMKADGTYLNLTSTTKTLYSLGYHFIQDGENDDQYVQNGHFEISAGSGLMRDGLEDGGEYFFEAGTEVKFRLVPDYGYRYDEGTFCFNGDNSERVVRPLDEEAGTYLFVMPSNPIHVMCNFIPADNESNLDGTNVVSDVALDIPADSNVNGVAQFTVADTDLTEAEETAVNNKLGSLYQTGPTLALGLNSKIDKIGTEGEAWVTPVTELNDPMEVSLTLDLENEDFANGTDFKVVREHDGTLDTIDATYDKDTKTISFETDKYSNYTLAYGSKQNWDPISASSFTVTDETVDGANDGKIGSVDNTFEYSIDDGETWTTVSGSEITGLADGKVLLRKKGDETHNPSNTVELTIARGTVYVTAITLSKNAVTLTASGATETLSVKSVTPADADNKNVTWTTDNDSVVTVDTNGKITAVGNGTATITATASGVASPGTVTATCEVSVQIAVNKLSIYEASESTLDEEHIVSQINLTNEASTYSVKTVANADACNSAVTWESKDTSIATVNESGVITAVGDGETKIVAKAKDGSNVTATVAVIVKKSVESANAGEESTAGGAKAGSITAETNVASTVKDSISIGNFGVTTAKSELTTDELNEVKDADSNNTKQVNAKVSVYVKALENIPASEQAEIAAVKDSLPTEVTDIMKLDVSMFKTVGDNSERITEIDNPIQLTIKLPSEAIYNGAAGTSRNYTIIKNHEGEASVEPCTYDEDTQTVTATLDQFSTYVLGYYDTIDVTNVSLNKTSATLTKKDETVQLSANVEPANASVKDVTWTSSNPSVATVDNNGKVTAVARGTATITATSDDNTSIKANCVVTVDIKEVTPAVTVSYHTHIQTLGDSQGTKTNGQMAGTSGMAKRLENIWIKVDGNPNLGIQYTTHCQTYGWLSWSANGETNGTSGEAKRLEAIKIQLTGSDADKYDVYYRVHAQSYGWLAWVKNGEPSGTAGYAKRLEGIQVVVLKKGAQAPGLDYADVKASTATHNNSGYISKTTGAIKIPGSTSAPNVTYKTHVQSIGWQNWVYNGTTSGTVGLAKRLEGIDIKLTNCDYAGGIRYKTHVQSYGWEKNWAKDGAMSGTSGKAKRLEAIQIELYGEMANHYDVYYRVHAQSYGWLAWAKNGESAGTEGYAKRLEGIQIILVPKGSPAPAANYGGVVSPQTKAFIKK